MVKTVSHDGWGTELTLITRWLASKRGNRNTMPAQLGEFGDTYHVKAYQKESSSRLGRSNGYHV